MRPFIVKARPTQLRRLVNQTFACRFINKFYNNHMNNDLENSETTTRHGYLHDTQVRNHLLM
jgi:hypothetical protein